MKVQNVNVEVYVPVVEVTLKQNVCALLDNASIATFCTRRLLVKLNIGGSNVEHELTYLMNKSVVKSSTDVSEKLGYVKMHLR